MSLIFLDPRPGTDELCMLGEYKIGLSNLELKKGDGAIGRIFRSKL
jgi:hypothetical protein